MKPGRHAFPERYRIKREVGAGGAGVVYEAHDAERDVVIAIKTMQLMSAEALQRFKNEFRSLQGVRHPNLIALGDLEAVDDAWFFTMEYVDGVDFVRYVRSGEVHEDKTVSLDMRRPRAERAVAHSDAVKSRVDEPRLRDALGQLVRGLMALHAAGKVHRDIKPSNVLVTPGGRVVILDFGLIIDLAGPTVEDQGRVVGTPAFMAPEQIEGKRVAPPADWYAAGVLLFLALTGRLPFSGSQEDVMRNKRRFEPDHGALRDAPEDLAALCRELLRIDPAARPTGSAILERLGLENEPVDTAPVSRFVGRHDELRQLTEAFEQARSGATLAVLVEGASGIGKSALVRQFLEEMRAQPQTLVLSGRCSQRESVPFKSVDGVVDALRAFLSSLPVEQALQLLPANVGLLARMFPVLHGLPGMTDVPTSVFGGHELRAQTFAVFRRLMIQLARVHTLVLAIDDLQWSDSDSLSLLVETLRGPDAPPCLFVATMATGVGDEGAALDPDAVARALPAEVRRIPITGLAWTDTLELVTQLASRFAGTADAVDASVVAHESGGHPLFTAELVRHALGSPLAAGITLDGALRSRIERIDAMTRHILQIVCTAYQPITASVAGRASGAAAIELVTSLDHLGAAQLIRIGGSRASDRIEPYHSRIRAAVAGELTEPERVAHHARIARALEHERHDPAVLALHWQGAGALDVAAKHYLVAAEQASAALAFDRAIRMYRLALTIAPEVPGDLVHIRRQLGEALASSGRGSEAAETFLSAAAAAQGAEAFELERRAFQQFLVGGHTARGLEHLHHLMRELGVPDPRSPRGLLASVVFNRARVRLRGLRFEDRPADMVTMRDRARIDTCCDAAVGLSPIDFVRGQHFSTLNLLYSLKSGDKQRIARAVMFESLSEAGLGGGRRWQHVIDVGEDLARQLDTPQARCWITLARGISSTLLGRWNDAVALITKARSILDSSSKQVVDDGIVPTYLVSVARVMMCGPLVYLGRLHVGASTATILLREALERDDVAAATHFRTGLQAIVWLARGDVEVARQHVDAAIAPWEGQAGQVPHFLDVHGRVTLDLYARDGVAGSEKVDAAWPVFARSFLLRAQYVRITLLDLRGRAAVCAAHQTTGSTQRAYLRTALRCAARLEREGAPWGIALAHVLRAAIAETSESLMRAATSADAADMLMHATIARWCHGLRTKDEGLIGVGRAWSDAERVVDPERLAYVILPSPAFR